jgi:hypothetical protein
MCTTWYIQPTDCPAEHLEFGSSYCDYKYLHTRTGMKDDKKRDCHQPSLCTKCQNT